MGQVISKQASNATSALLVWLPQVLFSRATGETTTRNGAVLTLRQLFLIQSARRTDSRDSRIMYLSRILRVSTRFCVGCYEWAAGFAFHDISFLRSSREQLRAVFIPDHAHTSGNRMTLPLQKQNEGFGSQQHVSNALLTIPMKTWKSSSGYLVHLTQDNSFSLDGNVDYNFPSN